VAQTETELADEPQIPDDTVRTQVPSAMTKPGARSRTDLVARRSATGLARLN
jgi:DNA-binding NarL/FixJ family response regulator